jgi:hypothetical protein
MKKRLVRKSVLREMFERTYAPVLVIMIFLLFVGAIRIATEIIASAKGEGMGVLTQLSYTEAVWITIQLTPFALLVYLLKDYLSKDGRDLYLSLPHTRLEVFGSATLLSLGYFLFYMLIEASLSVILLCGVGGATPMKYYFLTRFGMATAVFVALAGLAAISLSTASGILRALGSFVVLFYVGARSFELAADGSVFFARIEDVWTYGMTIPHEEGDIVILGETNADVCREIVRAMGVAGGFGILLCILGAIAFVKRKAEWSEGRCKCRLMHVLLQAGFGGVMATDILQESYVFHAYWRYDNRLEFIFLAWVLFTVVVLIVWEAVYQRSIRKVWKVWPGVLFGFLYAMLLSFVHG